MMTLERNKKTIYFANYLGKEEVLDEEGYKTGEYLVKYTRAKELKANVSGAKGSSAVEVFGTELDYDKVIVISLTLFKSLKINKNSIFFIDIKPTYETNGYPIYNYRVKRIAETINEVSIALESVRDNG